MVSGNNIGKAIDFIKGLGGLGISLIVLVIAFGLFQFFGNMNGKSSRKVNETIVQEQSKTIEELLEENAAAETTIQELEDNFAEAIIKNAKLSAANDSIDAAYRKMTTAYEKYIKQLERDHQQERQRLIKQSNSIIFENFDL